ncbi:MAG: 23S rRNA (pseudouridine(1915)-N(3))-methyltransferase RlmH [Clostridia bacterium]|nr:23S rRNA (pseudouridine(1915)-N(3))-methyltransferase RlmH [Clostridia bacterium]
MAGLTVIAVGSLKEKYFRDAADEYRKRLSASWKVDEIEIKEEKTPASPSEAEIADPLEKEGDRILAAIPNRAYAIALSVEGAETDSRGLSRMIEDVKNAGFSSVCFIVGSSHGLSERVKKSCRGRLSMSKMTFPHELARVMLYEAVYRATEINRGTGYHK